MHFNLNFARHPFVPCKANPGLVESQLLRARWRVLKQLGQGSLGIEAAPLLFGCLPNRRSAWPSQGFGFVSDMTLPKSYQAPGWRSPVFVGFRWPDASYRRADFQVVKTDFSLVTLRISDAVNGCSWSKFRRFSPAAQCHWRGGQWGALAACRICESQAWATEFLCG